MPELPEVETVVRTLEAEIRDRKITDVHVIYEKMIETDVNEFKEKLKGEHFRGFERRGKWLIFRMDHVTLVSHLRMEGKYYIQRPEEPTDRHMHVIFDLDNVTQLRYHDTRKFGRMFLTEIDHDFTVFRNLGPEPFDPSFDKAYVHAYRKKRNIALKTLLLDQNFVAGIGNIYADEVLAMCELRPGRSCQRITAKDEENLVHAVREVLTKAIEAGGTTIRSYTSSLGVTGRFQTDCTVHMQKVCKKCGSDIKVRYIGGRSSYYCPKCQK